FILGDCVRAAPLCQAAPPGSEITTGPLERYPARPLETTAGPRTSPSAPSAFPLPQSEFRLCLCHSEFRIPKSAFGSRSSQCRILVPYPRCSTLHVTHLETVPGFTLVLL